MENQQNNNYQLFFSFLDLHAGFWTWETDSGVNICVELNFEVEHIQIHHLDIDTWENESMNICLAVGRRQAGTCSESLINDLL